MNLYESNAYSTWLNRRDSIYVRAGLRIIQEPQIEILTVDEAALHLRIDSYNSPPEYPEQSLIERNIAAARQVCEQYLGRSLATYLLEWGGWAFPAYEIELPMGPVQRIDSVEYTDSQGIVFVMDPLDYYLDEYSEVPRIVPRSNWPSGARWTPGSVRVRYFAGYVSRSESPSLTNLPWALMAAMLLVIGHLYENREDTTDKPLTNIPNGARSLMDPYKVRIGMA